MMLRRPTGGTDRSRDSRYLIQRASEFQKGLACPRSPFGAHQPVAMLREQSGHRGGQRGALRLSGAKQDVGTTLRSLFATRTRFHIRVLV